METQSYAKHAKYVPLYHGLLAAIIIATLIGSIVNLLHSLDDHSRLYSASLITAICLALMLLFIFCRTFPLKAQDRAIRAEENLRHFALTGKLLDKRLSVKQIVGLRFASDEELPALASRAASENLSPDAIKKSVKNWKTDTDRL